MNKLAVFDVRGAHRLYAELGHKMGSLRAALRARFYAPIQGALAGEASLKNLPWLCPRSA
jgi:hypothetical protein